jgi:5'-nucleotidase
MTIILTNDDGIDAPGLEALYEILSAIGPTVVVAPAKPQSGVAHQVTVRKPIRVERISPHRYQVDGTPADCTRIALKSVAPDATWVVAGINPGANLGSDVYNSGTVAAAREAAILGCRSMAVSQYIAKDHGIDWDITGRHAAPVVAGLMDKEIEKGCFWNVNLPHPLNRSSTPAHVFCDLDINPHAYTYRREKSGYIYVGTIHERPREPGRDVAVCFSGAVSISRLGLAMDCR